MSKTQQPITAQQPECKKEEGLLESEREQLSAWMDGEDKMPRTEVLRQPEAQQLWEAYQLMGEVLRDPEAAAMQPSDRFRLRLQERLQQEPKPKSRFNTLRYMLGSAALIACIGLIVWAFRSPIEAAWQREQGHALTTSTQQMQEALHQTYETYVRMHSSMVSLSPIDDDMVYITAGTPGTQVTTPDQDEPAADDVPVVPIPSSSTQNTKGT